ncbi:MAG TPA: polysaccharide pyruvyl transferase family protein [Gammaproteobacteria bacterium]|nr:polysaccharide pyruvyl transferase family protein [Gammaproteobacteria bacterium]
MESPPLPPQMQQEYARLAATIRDLADGRPMYYVANPGNLGDAIIKAGTEQFFRDFGIDARLVGYGDDGRIVLGDGGRILGEHELRDAVLLYGGGGGWCKLWGGGRRIVSELAPIFHHTVVLPSSYEITPDIPGVTFFARDRFESLQNLPSAQFCHDMGFYYRPARAGGAAPGGTGFCFRRDKESGFEKRWRIPLSNHDISWSGDYLSDVTPMFEYLSNFKTVHTDRLHVAIACSLLGVRVHLYPGAYFKNRAVFLTSIAPHFACARWRTSLPLSVAIRNSLQRRLGHRAAQ